MWLFSGIGAIFSMLVLFILAGSCRYGTKYCLAGNASGLLVCLSFASVPGFLARLCNMRLY
jgi:hypothetical protein